MTTSDPSESAGRVTGTMAPVDVSLCAHAITSQPGMACGLGASPGSADITVGSANHGAFAEAAANFAENSPNAKCPDFLAMSPNVAASQKAVAPPSEQTISYPAGNANNSANPARMLPTTFFTAGCRWEVPMMARLPATMASI